MEKVKRSKKSKSRPEDFINNLIGPRVENHALFEIMGRIYKDETLHKRYVKEMCKIYQKSKHDEFMRVLYQIILCQLTETHDNPHASMALLFISKFVAEYKNDTEENPCKAVINFILKIDGDPDLQYRSCEFVNTLLTSLGPDADLDDSICENILSHMSVRLKNTSPNVRMQAIIALTRLQDPNDPEDIVIKYFVFHLQSDPSPKVRHSIISHIAVIQKTIAVIIEKLWDIDESVRRETYRYMMSEFPIKGLRIEQRQQFLEQGLKDESPHIRKLCGNLLMKYWVTSYGNNYISFLCAIKLDAKPEELIHFEKIAKLTLNEIFKREKLSYLIDLLGFKQPGHEQRQPSENIDPDDEEEEEDDYNGDDEFKKCIPMKDLKLEHAVYWACLVQHVAQEQPASLDEVIPEISEYCKYLSEIYKLTLYDEMEHWEKQVFQFTMYNLLSNILHFDITDEIGRKNVGDFVIMVLKGVDLNERNIELLVKIMEKIMPDNEERLGIFQRIVTELYMPRDRFEFISDRADLKNILENHTDTQVKISKLKVDILDLEEEVTNFLSAKDYENAEKCTNILTMAKSKYTELLRPLFKNLPEGESKLIEQFNDKLSAVTIEKCLKLIFYAITSVLVRKLPAGFNPLFKDFIRRYMESNSMDIRCSALECATTFAQLFEPISKDVMFQLKRQFCSNQDANAWRIAVRAIFELLARYGLKHFDITDKYNSRRSTKSRQLFSGNEFTSQDEDEGSEDIDQSTKNVDILQIMSQLLMSCKYHDIRLAILRGYCTLCLCGDYVNIDIMKKLLTKYFDPGTDEYTSQMLGKFFEMLLRRGKQRYLEGALLPTIVEIVDAPYDSSLHEVKPSNVIRFVLNATKPNENTRFPTIHDRLAEKFLLEIEDNPCSNGKLAQALATDLMAFEISANDEHRKHLEEILDDILDCEDIDKKCIQPLQHFKKILNGTAANSRGYTFSSSRPITTTNSIADGEGGEVIAEDVELTAAIDREKDDDDDDEDEDEDGNVPQQQNEKSAPEEQTLVTNAESAPTPPPAKRREVDLPTPKSDDDDAVGDDDDDEDSEAEAFRKEAERSLEQNIEAINTSAQELEAAAATAIASPPPNDSQLNLELPVVRAIRSLRKSMNIPASKSMLTPKTTTNARQMPKTTGRRTRRRNADHLSPTDKKTEDSPTSIQVSPLKKPLLSTARNTRSGNRATPARTVEKSQRKTAQKTVVMKTMEQVLAENSMREQNTTPATADKSSVEIPESQEDESSQVESDSEEVLSSQPVASNRKLARTRLSFTNIKKTPARKKSITKSNTQGSNQKSNVRTEDTSDEDEVIMPSQNNRRPLRSPNIIVSSATPKSNEDQSSNDHVPQRNTRKTPAAKKIETPNADQSSRTRKTPAAKIIETPNSSQSSTDVPQRNTRKTPAAKKMETPNSSQSSTDVPQRTTRKTPAAKKISSPNADQSSNDVPQRSTRKTPAAKKMETPNSSQSSTDVSQRSTRKTPAAKKMETPQMKSQSSTDVSQRSTRKTPAAKNISTPSADQSSSTGSQRSTRKTPAPTKTPATKAKPTAVSATKRSATRRNQKSPLSSQNEEEKGEEIFAPSTQQSTEDSITSSPGNVSQVIVPDTDDENSSSDAVEPSFTSKSVHRSRASKSTPVVSTPPPSIVQSPQTVGKSPEQSQPPRRSSVRSPPRKSTDPNFVYSPLRKRKHPLSSSDDTPRTLPSNNKKSKIDEMKSPAVKNDQIDDKSIPQESPYPKARVSLSRLKTSSNKTPTAEKAKDETPKSLTRQSLTRQKSDVSPLVGTSKSTSSAPTVPHMTSRIPKRVGRVVGNKSTSAPSPRSRSTTSSAIPRARTISNRTGQIPITNRPKK